MMNASPEAFPGSELKYLPWREGGITIAYMKGTWYSIECVFSRVISHRHFESAEQIANDLLA